MEYDNTMGLLGFVCIGSPTVAERNALENDGAFSVNFAVQERVGFMVMQISKMFTFDAPFSPNVYSQPREYCNIEAENEGLRLTLLFIDSHKGELFQMRQIGLGHDFSNNFLRWCKKSLTAYGKMTRTEYSARVDSVFSKFSQSELARTALFSWTYTEPCSE